MQEFVDGELRILQAGKVRKIVPRVERITFSGDFARSRGREVLYVTERAVFRLEEAGLTLVEVAPGLDVGADILAHLPFRPLIGDVKTMPTRGLAVTAWKSLREPAETLVFDLRRSPFGIDRSGQM